MSEFSEGRAHPLDGLALRRNELPTVDEVNATNVIGVHSCAPVGVINPDMSEAVACLS